VAGAIGIQADQVITGLDAEAHGAFDKVFAELVHIERDRPPTRKRTTLAPFTADEGATTLIRALAGQKCRVLVTGGDASDSSVEVAHEKLFTAWPRLREWIDKSGEALRLIEYAEETARRWHETGGDLQELRQSRRAKDIDQALIRFRKKASPRLEPMLRPQPMLIARLEQDDLSHEDRLLIGKKLAEFGDLRQGVGLGSDGLPDIAWIDIPQDRIRLKDVDHVFEVKPFRIAKYPVTNSQFKAFIEDGGYENDSWWWEGIRRLEPVSSFWQEANAPRETVSWLEAVAFCRWLSQRTGSKVRLPNEWEWQQAATGGDPVRDFPWPGGWDASRGNSEESRLNRTTAVGMYPRGATQHGVLDMAGNVWEWCLNTYEQPETPESLRIDDTAGQRVIRGGSWRGEPGFLRASYRGGNNAVYWLNYVGFRLAQDLP